MKKFIFKSKNFILGLVIGVVIATCGTALADSFSLVGKTLTSEYPIKIDGQLLDIKAPVTDDGISLLPVRYFAETVGMAVYWDNNNKIIELETIKDVTDVPGSIITEDAVITDPKTPSVYETKVSPKDIDDIKGTTPNPNLTDNQRLSQINDYIQQTNGNIWGWKIIVDKIQKGNIVEGWTLEDAQQHLTDLQEHLLNLQQQKAELEAQLGAE